MNKGFESVSPFFAVTDVVAAIDFYCGSLGFELGWKWGEPPTHGNVCRDNVSISFSSASPGQGFSSVFVEVKDVEAFHKELLTKKIKVGSLEKRDYGMTDFLVVDPWENRLVFGQAIEN